MSYNLDSIEILKGKLKISKKDVLDLKHDFRKHFPEGCFLHAINLRPSEYNDELISLDNICWYGVGSGRSYEILENEIFPKLKGKATIIETWEVGDTIEKYTLVNGVKTNIEKIVINW